MPEEINSKIIQVADGIVSLLNGNLFSQRPIRAERKYLWLMDIAAGDLEQVKVTVIAAAKLTDLASRVTYQDDFTFLVAIQKKVDPNNVSECDAITVLNDEIFDFLRHPSHRKIGDAILVAILNDPIATREHLNEFGVYTSAIQVTYRMYVAK